jgi:multiple sugar transport system ATP-binding protein
MEDPGAAGQLLMSVFPTADISEEQSLSVVLDTQNLHLFDANTENAIAHGLAEQTGVESETTTNSGLSSDD